MRKNAVVMIGLAVIFGTLAVMLSHSWLQSQLESERSNIPKTVDAPKMSTIVVAKVPLRFGSEVSANVVKEIPWPQRELPPGAFKTVGALTSGEKRFVLTPIEPNEPVFEPKITGPGNRAALSAIIEGDMRAVTVRVNDVLGVAGFVLPGDRVDILLTKQTKDGGDTTDIILQGKRVLAIDQLADERADAPSVAKAVTLEVRTHEAQKVALAANVGTLSLMLRPKGNDRVAQTDTVTLTDLTSGRRRGRLEAAIGTTDVAPARPRVVTVSVTRASERKEYRVPVKD